MSLEKELEFFDTLSGDMSPEEIMLESLQTMIAAEISMKRQRLGLSQKEFAEMVHVKQSLVSRWESGSVNFQLSTLVKIASALDIKMQLPFLPSPAIHYGKDSTVIVALPQTNSWKSKTYHSVLPTSYKAETSEELKEN